VPVERVSKAEIARRLGVHPSTVSHWISRRHLPRSHSGWYDWRDIAAWARVWKRQHPHSLPGVTLGLDKELEKKLLAAEIELGQREKGCICPPGIISLTCPIHAGSSLT
jgi:IS30 family transposase